MEKVGIEQIKSVLMLILELGNVADYIGKHSEMGVTRFTKLTDLFDELVAMGQFDAAKLKAEYADLDEAEKAQLKLAIKEKFNIEDDKLEAKIEEGLDLVIEGYAFIMKVMSFAKAMKA